MTNDTPGQVVRISPLVRRLLADNPSPFTFTGTQTHIVGSGDVAVIDPGPDLSTHIEAILAAVAGQRVAAIMCTHNHRDHSPAARSLKAVTGAPIIGCAPLAPPADDPHGEAFDADHAPDRVLADGETVRGEGWSLAAIATPGHASNHLCFALAEEKALFSGDHVMGWSTSIVSPPDGDMTAYMASLERLLRRSDAVYYPAHGPPVAEPGKLVRGLILHRRQREAQILAQLARGPRRSADIVAALYRAVDPALHPAAERSVLAHLIALARENRVTATDGIWEALGGD